MKWITSLVVIFTLWSVSYSTSIGKRESVNDICNIGYATGTTGGSGNGVTTVSSLAALIAAVAGSSRKIVRISGVITGNVIVTVGSNTSLLGARGSLLAGVGLRIQGQNIIIRNIKVSKVLATTGDAINIDGSSGVCLDHLDLSSDRDHDEDFYANLLSITHGSKGVTVSNSKFSTHEHAALVGDSDSNGAQDSQVTVTFALNYWTNLDSAISPFRFGHGHIFNNLFENVNDGINPSDGAQLLVENNVGTGMSRAVYPTNNGFAVSRGNNFGGAPITAPPGTFTTPPYSYTLGSVSTLRSLVLLQAGQTLSL